MHAKWMAGLAVAAMLAACSSSEDAAAPGADASADAGAGGGVESSAIGQENLPPPDTVAYFNQVVGDRVFFGFDRHDLDAEARRTLSGQAEWLRNNPDTRVTVEGHADERGTREYNLALGARRANAARRFLVAEGVQPGRIETVSYGKERPVALCSAERCWSQNRRAVTVVAGAPAS
jgi:peptidoglycan-associated lipoprotein